MRIVLPSDYMPATPARGAFQALFLATCVGSVLSGWASAQTVEYFSMWNQNEPQAQVLSQVFEACEAETGVKVETTWSGRDVLTRLRPRILSGDPPELVDQSHSELFGALLANNELALPVNDLLDGPGPEGEETFASIFDQGLLDLYLTDGNYYFVPYEYITSGFFYNKTIFDEYGLKPPETWQALMDLSATLKENGVPPFMQDNIPENNNYWYYYTVDRQMGPGALLAAASDPTGQTWDEPGYLEAAKMIQQISAAGQNYFQEDYLGSTWPAAQNSWAQGRGAMSLNGSWVVSETASLAAEGFEAGYFPFPKVGDDGSATMEAYLIGLAILKDSSDSEFAKKVVLCALKEEYQQMIVSDALNMAARKNLSYPEPIQEIQPFVENAPGFHIEYDFTQARLPEWYARVFTPLGQELLHGQVTAEDFISQIKDESVRYWERQ